jgi:biopolymer transport protein TolR
MSVSIESGGRGRRKDVNADLLLVPYIDLLTCMVAFLLITAVWTQLARLSVQQKGQGESGGFDLPQTKIGVLVHQDGFAVIVNDEQHPVPQLHGDYDFVALAHALEGLKRAHPDKTDLQVMSDDPVRFDTIIQTMDAVMASGFPDVSLLDAGSSAL